MPGETLAREARIFVQVAQGTLAKDIPPPLPAMFGRVMKHMAALAQCGKIARQIVTRIVIEMCAGEHDIGRPDTRNVEPPPDRDPSATIRTPIADIGIPPPPVTKMRHKTKMRSRAPLAARAGTIEANRVRQLLPIDRV